MSAPHRLGSLTGALLLATAWAGPLPGMAVTSFSAHMALHLLVAAVVAPLLAWGVVGERATWLPKSLASWAIAAAVFELVLVWAWHAPVLHRYARSDDLGFILEQASFLLAGLVLWSAAFAGLREPGQQGAGIAALLMTAMHMSLLGALLALSPRPLYSLGCLGGSASRALADQHGGGILMLLVGGCSYLVGALLLASRLLRSRAEIMR